MQTLLLLGLGWLVLGQSQAARPQQTVTAQPPAPAPNNTGSDIAAAFGAFIGAALEQYNKGSSTGSKP